jgi:predicted nucleic acid-binding protein
MLTVTTPNVFEAVVVDSSGWLEYMTGDTKADLFSPYLLSERPLLVPAIVLYEVRKILLLRQTKNLADRFVSEAVRHEVIPVDQTIALAASAVSVQYGLAMADALLFTTAEQRKAEFVTSDNHFKDLPGVTLL